MYNWVRRHRGAITFALSILVISLVFANAWKHELISVGWLKEHKDALSALNSIVTLLVFLAVSVFSYYRFFRGRTLALRAEPKLEVSVHDTTSDFNIHSYHVKIKNVGTSTIWNPKPHLRAVIHGPPGVESEREVSHWYEEKVEGPSATVPVIEADETVSFFGRQKIEKSAWAVTYIASIRADSGDYWFVSKTISNLPDKSFQ